VTALGLGLFLMAWLGGVVAGVPMGMGLAIRRQRWHALTARTLPLPVPKQVWRLEGVGRVRIESVSPMTGTVSFCRPHHDPDADPLVDGAWRDPPGIEISLDQFDIIATLEHR